MTDLSESGSTIGIDYCGIDSCYSLKTVGNE